MKTFLSVVSVLMVLLGTAWTCFPEAALHSWAVDTNAAGIYVGRRYGALFGYAAILWLARGAGPSEARTAILGGVVTGTVGPGAWEIGRAHV